MKNNFESHRLHALIWIVRQLQREPLTLKEINKRWKANVDLSGGKDIERRTFFNYLRAIGDLFHIDIECSRPKGCKYVITCDELPATTEHMLANFETGFALEQVKDLEWKVLMEKIPAGHEYLDSIIKAIRDSVQVSFVFRHFNMPDSFEVIGDPYGLMCYQQRWYLICKDEEGVVDTYSLDRIIELSLLDTHFDRDPNFDAKEFFRYSFGVRVNQDDYPEVIKLKINKVQCDYLRTLPLHASQIEAVTCPDYSIFTIEVVPTVELTMKILSMGMLCEVLEPKWYREQIKHEVKALHDVYYKKK